MSGSMILFSKLLKKMASNNRKPIATGKLNQRVSVWGAGEMCIAAAGDDKSYFSVEAWAIMPQRLGALDVISQSDKQHARCDVGCCRRSLVGEAHRQDIFLQAQSFACVLGELLTESNEP